MTDLGKLHLGKTMYGFDYRNHCVKTFKIDRIVVTNRGITLDDTDGDSYWLEGFIQDCFFDEKTAVERYEDRYGKQK